MRFLLIPAILALHYPPGPPRAKGGVGDLMVMPTRVIIENRDRSAEVALRNSGRAVCTYRISFREMRMVPSGKLEVVPKAEGGFSAADLVRFTPRQVELKPGETQTIRIQLRKPEGLKDGEYRSHLVFQGLPPVEPPKPTGRSRSQHHVLRYQDCRFPIHPGDRPPWGNPCGGGARGPEPTIPSLKADEPPVLGLTLELVPGNRSVQGDFKVEWLPRSGRAKTVLPLAGVVLYPEITSTRA